MIYQIHYKPAEAQNHSMLRGGFAIVHMSGLGVFRLAQLGLF
jgi:hypothetical protein